MKKPYYLYSVGGFRHGPFTYEQAVKGADYENANRWEGDPAVHVIDRTPTLWEMLTSKIKEARKPA
jgi:hypothetical protein